MFEISNQFLLISTAIALLCGGFIYFFMNQRINSMEEDMSNMFNLLSSLNEEQKRVGNLVVYSLQQQQQQQQQVLQPQPNYVMETNTNDNVLTINEEVNEEHANSISEIEVNYNVIDENKPLFENTDNRVVVSEDEGDEGEVDTHVSESKIVVLDTENMDGTKHDDTLKTSTTQSTSFKELNKLKVNELKEYLETLNLSRDVLAKAKKLKKKEMMDFILSLHGETSSSSNSDDDNEDSDDEHNDDVLFDDALDNEKLSDDEELAVLDDIDAVATHLQQNDDTVTLESIHVALEEDNEQEHSDNDD